MTVFLLSLSSNLWLYVTLFASSTYGVKRLKDLYRYAHDKQENEENKKLQEQVSYLHKPIF